jgi:hypothetical protein
LIKKQKEKKRKQFQNEVVWTVCFGSNINISENNHRNLTRKKKKNLTTIKPHEIMAGRLTNVASQILGGNGVVHRSVASSLRLRSGMGLPVGKHYVPDKPVSFL